LKPLSAVPGSDVVVVVGPATVVVVVDEGVAHAVHVEFEPFVQVTGDVQFGIGVHAAQASAGPLWLR
jgi:hypothetical protein